jgi:tRNA G18 (ribose-2'-O)-methylase SpoU
LGVFVVESARAVRQLFASDWPVGSVLLRPERLDSVADVVAEAQARGVPVYVADRDVYDAVAGFPVHRGVLALGIRRPEPAVVDLTADRDLVLVVEGVNDHENMGALFRDAAAFGVGAVLLDPSSCDPLYRRSIRVSVGHVLRMPFARVEPWPAGLSTLTRAGFGLFALDPSGPATIEDAAALRPGRVAVLVGSEDRGLSAGALAAATARARIPMAAGVDSLNVAVAAAVALHRLAGPEPGRRVRLPPLRVSP